MEELLNPVQQETVEVVDIQFRPGQKVYFFDPAGAVFAPGDHVIMDTARGPEFGICAAGNHTISIKEVVAPLRKILRRATEQDEKVNAENRSRERRAFEICMQKIQHHGLDMQLVSAECAFDGSKILFYFTADERVDFRELVKDLAGVFHTRIELRQIGVRDKAKMVGGLGICGRPFCCASFLDDFQPVSIKMAKTQNLSLNPTKISGTCGRLMCCLKYEQDTYESLIRSSPKVDSFVDTPEGRGTVVESEILRQRVKVQMENNPDTVNVFSNEEIAVLRSGKAKKNDPPIPADLAPISGSGKRPDKPREQEAPVLEPIRFRYRTEAIVEEAVAQDPQPEAEQRPSRSRRRRGRGENRENPEQAAEVKEQKAESPSQEQQQNRQRRDQRRKQELPRGEKPEKQENREQPKEARPPRPPKKAQPNQQPSQPNPDQAEGAPAGDGEAKKPRRRPNHYRHRKPKAPQA
ncbi:MAG: regulatory iron-sulfur-containing complex subunit RicT [Candidatus Faecousia sp.]|nr:regulatory iron-sulfur-containing complex subunit RicT [Candidatus Faecousia sp.]